jgi:SOS-response transcriptional repressor LexA
VTSVVDIFIPMSTKKKAIFYHFERTQPVHNDFLDIPLLGQVRPNDPAHTSGDYDLSDLIHNFANIQNRIITVEVLDDAMIDTGIHKGDYLTIDLDSHPDDGDLAVVKLGERIFVRKFSQADNRIRLETADSYPSLLIVESDTPNFAVLGKVQSLTRHL